MKHSIALFLSLIYYRQQQVGAWLLTKRTGVYGSPKSISRRQRPRGHRSRAANIGFI